MRRGVIYKQPLQPFLEAGELPEGTFDLPRGTEWRVLAAPVLNTELPSWRDVKSGEYVRVPMFPYIVNSDAADVVLAAIGVCAELLTASRGREYCLAVGDDVLPKDNGQVQFWVGFAMRVQ